MKIKLGIGVCCFFFSVNTAISQINYGTTGLMNLYMDKVILRHNKSKI